MNKTRSRICLCPPGEQIQLACGNVFFFPKESVDDYSPGPHVGSQAR